LLLACEQPNGQINWIWYNRGELLTEYDLELRRNGYELTYGGKDSTGVFQVAMNAEFNWDDRAFKIWDVEDCELLDSLTLEHRNEQIKIYKFFYDNPDSEDEELYVYLTREQGILGFVEFAWSGHQLLVNSNNKELLNKLESDTTGFFSKSKKYGI
jgi:hypothetical protein